MDKSIIFFCTSSSNKAHRISIEEIEWIINVISRAENENAIAKTHQLIVRNKISSKPKSIIKAIKQSKLKPFNFLINNN